MKRKAMLRTALAWLLIWSMIFPNTALTAYAAEAGTGTSMEQGTQAQITDSVNGGADYSEDARDENAGSGDETSVTDGENTGSGDEGGSTDGENTGSGDEGGSTDGENTGSGDENGVTDGENTGSEDEGDSTGGDEAADEDADADAAEGDEATDAEETIEGDGAADDKENVDGEKISIDKKADSLAVQTTETVKQGTFADLEVRIGMYQAKRIDGYYTPANEGVTSEDQLKIVLEQLDSQDMVLATKDIYFFKSSERYHFYDYAGVVLNQQAAKVRIKVTETVDDAATDYVSEIFTRKISDKTPVFTMTQNGEAGVKLISYNWSVKDYEPNETSGISENFKLQFTYCKKGSSTSQTAKDTIYVYANNPGTDPSGTVTLENLAENTTYTVSAKIYITETAGTEIFTQTITLPEFTTGTDETYTFAEIIPDETLRLKIANLVSGLSATSVTVTKSQLEQVASLSASRDKVSDAAIKNLKGIEYLTNLDYVMLENHELTDISNVNWSSLTKLRYLSLEGNDISEAFDLSGMVSLQSLYLKENMLSEEAVAAIRAKLPASCTYVTFDKQRPEGVILLAEPVYYQVNGTSPLFVKIKGLKTGLRDHVISFEIDGTPVTFQRKSSYIYNYYLTDSGLKAGTDSHTIKATVDDVTKEAVFQIEATDPVALHEGIICGTNWSYEAVALTMVGNDKSVTDIKVTDASGTVYGENGGISGSTTKYDARYQIVGDGYDLDVGEVYQLKQYYGAVKTVYSRTPAGSYDLVITYSDGTDQTIKDVFRVMGADQVYITDVWSASGYDNLNDYLYLTINGENVDFSKLTYKVTDQNGIERTLSYVSAKKCNYAGNETSTVVKLKKTDWKPKAGERITIKLTAKDGYQIELFDDEVSCYLKSGVFYAEWNEATNAVEVAVTQDMEISRIRVELKKCKNSSDAEGEDFLSGETDQISQGFASVPLTDSEGNTVPLLYGKNYYRLKVYLNGSDTPVYSVKTYLSNYFSTSSDSSYWSGGSSYLTQGTQDEKYYYYMLGYDTYKDAAFRAELLDHEGTVQNTWSDIEKTESGDYLQLLVADSTDFCELAPGAYDLKIYYQTAAMETESYDSYRINILEANKFLMSSVYGNWIEDDTIQLNISTVNAADAAKLQVQMFDSEGNELTGITTSVERTSGNTVYLNLELNDLTYENARKGYYFKVTHSTYGAPYKLSDNAAAYYTDEKGSYESLYYYGLTYATGSNKRTVGIGYRGFTLPIKVEAYLPYDTEVQASFTANSRNNYGSGYSWIKFPQSFINQLKNKNRLYDIVVTDSNGRSAVSRKHALGYLETPVKLTGLTMSPTTLTLAEGATGKLSVTAKPSNASLPALTWSSSDTEVATVNASGVVKAVSAGTAAIKVTGGGYSATCKVTVQAQMSKPIACDLTEDEGTCDPETGVITVNKKGTVVKLQSDTTGAAIYYTTDGTDPTTKSTKYNATTGITLIKDTTVKAIAVKSGYVNSEVATISYKIKKVTVTFKAEGAAPEEQTQTLYVGEYLDVSKISDPVYEDDAYYFDHWMNQGTDGVWQKLDVNNAVTDSFTCEAYFAIKERLDAPKANFESNVTLPYDSVVTFSVQKVRSAYAYEEETSGESAVEYATDAVIYYTLDGTEPTLDSEVYTGSITLTEDMADDNDTITIQAIATGMKYLTSSVSTYTYMMMTEDEVKESLGDVLPEDIPSDGVADIEAKGLWIAGVDESGYTYTGSAIKPSVRVYDGTKLLTVKKDYTISYSNNTNVPKDEYAKQPTIKIIGKGNYNGIQEVNFKILPKDISDSDMTAADIYTVYNNKVQKKAPVLKWGKKTLSAKKDKDYSIDYHEDSYDAETAYKAPGRYRITLTGQGNYTGAREVTETILDKQTEYPVSKLTVTMKDKKPQYTGNGITAEDIGLVVKNGKTVLEKGTDYELTYRNNESVGTATVTVKGLHEYVGTKDVTFQITGVAMSKVKLESLDGNAKAIQDVPYTTGTEAYTQSNYKLTYSYKVNKTVQTVSLDEDTDYTVSYQNNTKVGTAKIIFTGKGKYTGTLTKTFKITQSAEFKDETVKVWYNGDELTHDTTIPYSKGGVKPEITVKIGDTELVNGTDYKVSYKNNTKLYDGLDKKAKAPTITITGKGNYKGAVTKTFKISAQDITELAKYITAADVVWKDKKNNYKTKVVITDLDGKVLKEDTDYTLTYYQASGKKIEKNDRISLGDTGSTTITVKATGKGAYAGNKEAMIETTFRLAKNDFSKVKLANKIGAFKYSGKIADQRYTGKEIMLEKQDIVDAGLCIKVGKTFVPLTEDDFTIVGYKNNVKKGTATVILKGTGAYAGQKSLTFKIVARSFVTDEE